MEMYMVHLTFVVPSSPVVHFSSFTFIVILERVKQSQAGI